MPAMYAWWCAAAISIAGCLSPNVVVCGDGRTCPASTTCIVALGLCASQPQLDACEGAADGAFCDITPDQEICQLGVCVPVSCGNTRMDPGELCDDGNTIAGDGCSADCRSRETCGNGVPDTIKGEECDDGNLVAHDGCSSTCGIETPAWSRLPITPTARMAPAMTYDSARDRVVLVGGAGDQLSGAGIIGVQLVDAWEWDGRWHASQYQPPTPRFGAAMTFNPKTKRPVFFGGQSSELGELWELDADTWKLVSIEGPHVALAAVVYDPFNDRVLVSGGLDAETGETVATTTAWTGTSWVPIPDSSEFAQPRWDHAIAFDPKRNKLVLFGGRRDTDSLIGELWEYSGVDWTWTKRVVSGGPSPRAGMSMAWNATCECIVIYGGYTATNPTMTDETWTWDGTAWANITTSSGSPPARRYAGFADDGHGRTILVGGQKPNPSPTENNYFEETWVFDGTKWRKETGRINATVAVDLDRHRVVMFGGTVLGSTNLYGPDTFELGDAGWRLVDSTSGPPVRDAAIAYDGARHETVLVGGVRSGGAPETATWIWNGATWATRATTTQPPPRFNHALVYDAARAEIVAFGGLEPGTGTSLGDTWTWNGTTWTQKQPATSPPRRYSPAIGYDRVHDHVVLFGGTLPIGSADNTTWTWDGTTWSQASGGTMPSPSSVRPYIAWDPARRKLVLVSGDFLEAWEWTGTWWSPLGNLGNLPSPVSAVAYSSFGGAGITISGGSLPPVFVASDTHELRWGVTTDGEVCNQSAIDHDGDAAAGCADPDCWAVCTPSCMPGETCGAGPRCGDGQCGVAESCRTCAADCPSCGNICGDGQCDAGEACPGDC